MGTEGQRTVSLHYNNAHASGCTRGDREGKQDRDGKQVTPGKTVGENFPFLCLEFEKCCYNVAFLILKEKKKNGENHF